MPPPAEGFATRLVRGPALRTQPDRRLVTLVRGGYEAAFEEIVRRYGTSLNRYAAAIVGSRSEDVVQDSFSKALLALRREGAEIELRPWLYRIVRNTALNDLRDRPPSAEVLAEAIAGGANPAEEAERHEELTDLMQRLQSLPEPQRAAIVMRELEGLSHEEIAAALGLSGGAARQAIYRARRALRDGLGLLLPLPLLKALLAGGALGGAEVAAGAAGAGGATVGAGAALKAATATMLVAGAVGTGVAIQETRQNGDRSSGARSTGVAAELPPPSPPSAEASSSVDRSEDRGHGGGEGRRSGNDSGGRGPDDDRSGPRHDAEDDLGNSGPGSGDGESGRSGPSHDGEEGGGHSGSSHLGSSGPGSGTESEEELDNSSGSGSGSSSSGSGSSGSGGDALDSSGPGSGGGDSDEEELEQP